MTDLGPEIVAREIGDEILTLPRRRGIGIPPHRIGLGLVGAALVFGAAMFLRWDWLPLYIGRIVSGVGETVMLLIVTTLLGFVLAVPIGLAQVIGSAPVSIAARTFCTVIRGTPLLLQLWLLYYGLGSVFPMVPGIRDTVVWPYLRQAWPYAVVALTLSFAGYEGEVMRGAFAGTPRGEIEAARAFGMSPFTLLRRVWLPLAFYRALPTLAGETVLQLKSTPLVATITVVDVYAVFDRVRQDTYITYEPLLLLALIYCGLTGLLILAFRTIEKRLPTHRV